MKLKAIKNLVVYKKEEMDPSLHYKNNRRIMPIIVSTAVGYRLCKNATVCDRLKGNPLSISLLLCSGVAS